MKWLCRLQLHSGKWEYPVQKSCEQVFVCTRYGCEFRKNRTKHKYIWEKEHFERSFEEVGEAHGCPTTVSTVTVTGYVESCKCERCGDCNSKTVEETRKYSDTIGVS